MGLKWVDGFRIGVTEHRGEVTVSANREGMLSLVNILLSLAEGRPGDHIHLDEHNSLEDGSCGIVIERVG